MPLADNTTFFAATDTGRKRKHNEDNFLVDHELGLYIVADGMGGHAAGEVASAIAVRTVHEVLNAERDMLQARATQGPQSEVSAKQLLGLLEYAIQSASQRIHAEARDDPRKRGMGTTISLMLVLESSAYIAHVGDSRIYLMRDNEVNQVTEDHTVANELLRLGMVTPSQLDNVPRKNAITRAVGVYAHAEVDTVTLELLPNDQFLLASDGLCGYFDDNPAEDMRSYLGGEDGDEVVKSLIEFANAMGGKDNITAVVVRIGGGDTTDSVRARRIQLKREMLSAMPLFSRLNERELLRVMQIADVYEYERGEVVVNEGENGERMFVTLAGKLEVMTNNQKVAEYGPGEHFGEMALIRSRPRSATIRAVERAELITMKREDFFELIRTEPHVAVKLLWQFLGVIANRLEVTSRDLGKALGEGKQQPKPWVDDEPSLDPFTTMPGLNRLSFHPEIALDGLPTPKPQQPGALPPATQQAPSETLIDDSPSVDEAPAVAQRNDAPSFANAPAMAARREDDSSSQSAEFDVRSTVPRELPIGPVDDASFDKRKTLPGRSRPRGKGRYRQSTLKSADSMRAATQATKRGMQPVAAKMDDTRMRGTSKDVLAPETSAPAEPQNADPIPMPDDSERNASTQPDGKLREARSHALQEEARMMDAVISHKDTPGQRENSARETAADPELDRKKTVAMTKKSQDPFRPTKRTIPLEPSDSLRSELDALRKEFKERLKKSRRARKRKDSD